MDKLAVFINRLEKVGIKIEMFCNYPWVYLDKINGQRVTQRFHSEHGFTVAFMPIKKDQELRFTDIPEIFRIIRLYVK